jgi:hypothetical protein
MNGTTGVTMSEFTGFKDTHGNYIYAGQAVAYWCDEGSYEHAIVVFRRGKGWVMENPYWTKKLGIKSTSELENFAPTHCTVLQDFIPKIKK